MQAENIEIAPPDPVTADLTPYRLLREIGRGGMSVVYEALDTRSGQRAALKVLALPFSVTAAQRSELVARFRREERAVTQLSHPNIVAIQEIGERTGVHFIAMEFLPGESLRARLERGPLPLPEAGAVLAQIAAALTAVHGAGIVHRDVKPSNIMLLPDGSAKLLDFGVARHSDDTAITSGGLVVGSPAYLSPEQVRGGAGTAASDVWALGVLLYEMLAGRPPFQATDVAAVMYQVIHEPPHPLPNLTPGLSKVLKHALEKAPERRFPSASALAEAFTKALLAEGMPRPQFRPAALPRWAWGLLPLLFVLAVAAGLRGGRSPWMPAPPLPASPSSPMASLPAPVASASVVPPRPVAAVLVPAVPVPTVPVAVQSSLRSVTPPVRRPAPAPLAATASAAVRPRHVHPSMKIVPAAAPPSKPVVVRLPPPRFTIPHRKTEPEDVGQTMPEDTPPVEAAPPPVPTQPAPVTARSAPARHKPSKADEDAEAERLQRFIWSEGR